MKDWIRAMLGPRRCPWCVEYDPSWWDRFCRYDELGKDHWAWYAKLYHWIETAIDFSPGLLPLWKLGENWHRKHHAGTRKLWVHIWEKSDHAAERLGDQ